MCVVVVGGSERNATTSSQANQRSPPIRPHTQAAYNPSARRHGGPETPEPELRVGKALQAVLDELGRRLLRAAGAGRKEGTDETYPVLVVASCDEGVEDLCHPIRKCFTHELPVPLPEERRRRQVRDGNGRGVYLYRQTKP